MIKAFISDIDDTILPPGEKYASEENTAAILKLQAAGITLILATARLLPGVEKLIEQFQMEKYHGYVVSSNGSYLYDCHNKKVVDQTTIPLTTVRMLYDFSRANDLHFSCDLSSYCIISGFDEAIEFDWKVVGISFFLPGGDFLEAVTEEPLKAAFTYNKDKIVGIFPKVFSEFEKHLTVQLSAEQYIDFVPFGVNKRSGIEKILEILDLLPAEVAAIGDGNNDIPMFELIGLSAAVKNSSAEVQSYADMLVPSCEEDGVAFFIEYLLNTKL